jgi:ATP-dependent Clp protease adapter protein ClpS
MYELTEEELEVLRGLHNKGCAVCVFLPQEFDGVEQERIEDAMCEAGWGQIT